MSQGASASPFVFLWNSWVLGLAATTAQQVQTALAAVATVVTGVLTIYIALLWISVMFHKVSMAEFQTRAVRCVVVIALSSPSVFSLLVVDLFQNRVPAFGMLASTGEAETGGFPEQFNRIGQAAENMVEAAKMQTDRGFFQGGYGAQAMSQRLEISICGGCIAAVIMAGFFIVLASVYVRSIVIVIFAITVWGWLFKSTSAIADRTVSKLMGLSLVGFVCEIVVQQLLIENQRYLNIVGSVGQNVELIIAALWHVFWVFLGGILGLSISVSLAAYIGGGIGFSALTPMVVLMRTAAAARVR